MCYKRDTINTTNWLSDHVGTEQQRNDGQTFVSVLFYKFSSHIINSLLSLSADPTVCVCVSVCVCRCVYV